MNDIVQLVEPMIPALRRYARAMVQDRAAADDLVQDCLERVISRWHQRRPDGNTRSWVFAILHNLAANQLRQRTRRGTHVAVEDASDTALAIAPQQEDRLHYNATLEKLAELPEEMRSVLLLVTVEELSYADAARALDIPVGTVMSRLSRARDRLQKLLNEPTRAHLRRVK